MVRSGRVPPCWGAASWVRMRLSCTVPYSTWALVPARAGVPIRISRLVTMDAIFFTMSTPMTTETRWRQHRACAARHLHSGDYTANPDCELAWDGNDHGREAAVMESGTVVPGPLMRRVWAPGSRRPTWPPSR